MPLAIPILLAAAIAGYLLLRRPSADASPGVPPQPGSDRPVTGAFQNAADGTTARAAGLTQAPPALKPKPLSIRISRPGGGRVDPSDFARGFGVAGYSTAQLISLASRQAPRGFAPHNIAQEGQVGRDARGRYIRVKFSAAGRGSTTENVYLPH